MITTELGYVHAVSGNKAEAQKLLGKLHEQAARRYVDPLLYLITVIRSGLQITTNNYLPFMLEDGGYTLTETGNVLTVFLLLGGVGGVAGGFTAERFSGRAVTLYSGLLAGPLMIGALQLLAR